MNDHVLPVLYTLFVWWFSTGVVLYLDGLPRRTFGRTLVAATGVLGAALYALWSSSADTSVAGAYLAFTGALLVWGWQELAYYLGLVSGPQPEPCPAGCNHWQRFGRAVQATLYHELAVLGFGLVIIALTWGGANQIGTFTYLILWSMRLSAKLNVFLGVRNLNEEWLPAHLAFLVSFFGKRPINAFFPVAVTIATVIAAALTGHALAHEGFAAAAFTFLATLMWLAILEHWLLVLPLPATALWRWGLRSHEAAQRPPSPIQKRSASPPAARTATST